MVHSYGYRSGTRNKFSKTFRKKGMPSTSRVLQTFRLNDHVDIVADPAVQKGLPHKFYHGRTGRVFNVTPRGVGVIINKVVKTGKVMQKRICVRSVHLRPSRCQDDFKQRVESNRKIIEAKNGGRTVRRVPGAPRAGFTVKGAATQHLGPIPVRFEDLWKI
eukprot:TRINITY_DN510_c0_g1_i1.p1 TRINITY_DN510_c0_g1~~TRINITY_DN510_c0_g1_i1.p1  ORF type:complete len:161 (+),score=31.09 TRINITY_DN510_c0_g1_i1:51-533(+)